MQRQVFLSYSRQDGDVAGHLARALDDEGIGVWWDQDIRDGDNWIGRLEAQLGQVDCVVVLWSAASVESRFVLTEAMAGLQRGILVPVLVEPCFLPEPFDQVQTTIDLSAWRGGNRYAPFRRLVECIEREFEGQEKLDGVGAAAHELDALFDKQTVDNLWQRAQNGDPEAQYQIGYLCHYGRGGFEQDPSEALSWYEEASRRGSVEALYEIGNLFWGFLEDNEPEAVKWFQRAARAGHADAAWNVYYICARGLGIRKNLRMANEFLELAARLGHAGAQDELGW